MDPHAQSLLDESIGCLDLSVRTANTLDRAGIMTVRQLLNSCPHTSAICQVGCRCVPAGQTHTPTCYLLDVDNFGEKTLIEVRAALAAAGFTVRSKSVPADMQQQTVSSVTGGPAAARKVPRL